MSSAVMAAAAARASTHHSVGDLSTHHHALDISGRPVTASTSIDLIDLSSDPSEIYVNVNPGYKSMTPPDDVVRYVMPSPPVLESAPASLTSLRHAGTGGGGAGAGTPQQPDIVPPRSLTAPNVRGLEDTADSEGALWQPRSPRASWAGPQTSSSSSHHYYRDSPEFHVYDEVYIPRMPSPPPPRSASLQNSPLSLPATRNSRVAKNLSSGLSRAVSHIPVPCSTESTAGGSTKASASASASSSPSSSHGALERRSGSFQAMHHGGSGVGASGSASSGSPSSSPSPTSAAAGKQHHHHSSSSSRRQSKESPSPSKNYVEVWIPQIAHRQSASFAGLTPKEEQKHQSRLSQSCEQLEDSQVAALKRSKRRCPTPPRVLSPTNSESLKCEIIADI